MNAAWTEWKKHAPEVPPLPDGKRWHVFLSYRSVNRPWVINLYDVLREHGYEVFLDQCVMTAGDSLIERLEEGLAGSAAGVLIWSTTTVDSKWCRREYEVMEQMSDDGEFHFVPVKLDEVELPPFVNRRLFLSFEDYPDGPNGGELLRLLWGVVNQPLPADTVSFATRQDEVAREANSAIRAAIKLGNAARLQELASSDELAWTTSPVLGCLAAEGLTRLEAYDEALAVLDPLLKTYPRSIRPKQLRALALRRRRGPGDNDDARMLLTELYEAGERDPETMGILGAAEMVNYEDTNDRASLEMSRDYYKAAFEAAPDDTYCGVNAAAKSVFLGRHEDLELAQELALKVQESVGKEVVPGNYWGTATVAEVFLMQKDFDAAARLYGEAVAMARREKGSHRTTLAQARRLMEHLGPSDEQRAAIEKVFAHLQ